MPKDLDLQDVMQAVADVQRLTHELKSSADEREKELLKKTDIDPLLADRLGKINAELDKKQELIDQLYTAQRRTHVTVDGVAVDSGVLDLKAAHWARGVAAQRDSEPPADFDAKAAAEYKAAFYSAMINGDKQLTGAEEKALRVGADRDGGYFVDPDTSGRVVTRMLDTSPVRRYASVQVITSTSLEGTYDLDEADSGWTNETASPSETSTPQIGKWSIPVHEQYASPKATQKLLDDAGADVESWLIRKIADRFTRVENAAFVNGDGVNKPRGFLTYPHGVDSVGKIRQYATGVSGGFAATPNAADKLIQMQNDLKTAYQVGAVWAMNRTTLGQVRLLKNSDGNYLWQPALTAGQPSTLLGAPVAPFEDMPSYSTANALAVAYADFAELYQIVDRLGVRVLRDPYTSKPYVVFYATKRVGGDVVNFEAGNLLRFGA